MTEPTTPRKSIRDIFVAGYPPWFFKFWIKPANCKDEAESHRLLHLLRAIEDGNLEETRKILPGFDPNLRLAVDEGITQSFLEWACEKSKKPDCIRALVAAGADVKSGYIVGNLLAPPKSALLSELLAAGADPDTTRTPGTSTPLAIAAYSGLGNIVPQLLAAGANPNATSDHYIDNKTKAKNVTILMLAALGARLAILKTLIAAGADLHRTDSLGNNALSWARACRSKSKAAKTIEFLEKSGLQSTAAHAIRSRPDFTDRAKSPEFQQALALAQQLTGSKPKKFELAEGPLPGAKAFDLKKSANPLAFLDELRPQLQPLHAIAFLTEYLMPLDKSRLILLPTTDIYEAIAALETPEGQELSSTDLIHWLKKLAPSQPFDITTLSPDLLRARFLTKIKNPVKLTEEIARICPDVINDSIEHAAASLEKSRELYLWWD